MAKKQRTESPPVVVKPGTSNVFNAFRTVGLVSNDVPCCVSSLGETYIVSTSVGRAVQQFDAGNLNLLYMTQPQTSFQIESITAHFHHLFVVAGPELLVYKRGRVTAQTQIPGWEKGSKATKLVVFGSFLCVSYSSGVHVFKWDSKEASLEHYTTLTPSAVLGSIVGISHPPTYTNKLVVATTSCISLYNVKTGKCVYTFKEPGFGISGIESCPVALDIVALYGTDGSLLLFSLKTGKELFSLDIDEPISSCSFRSDTGSDSAPLLGVGTVSGAVLFYDLERRRRVQNMRSFASNPVHLTFLPGQPVCVLSSQDNSLTELVFDPPLATRAVGAHRARLLRKRVGCSTSPNCLVFADTESHFLFTASKGSLYAFSLRKDSQNRQFGNLPERELPKITAMAYSIEKNSRWDTIVTAHHLSETVCLWNASKFALGNRRLATLDQKPAKSVCTSFCGNFCLIGSVAGSVVMYNMQSGLKKHGFRPHKHSITGLALTPNNTLLITASLDGYLKFFDTRVSLMNPEPIQLHALNLESPITGLKYNENSGLVAVSTDNAGLVLVDTATFRVVREFYGHEGLITDFSFFPSGKMIVSASLDSTLRTFDLPSGVCVDAVKMRSPATHVSVSLNSEWIATSHTAGLGVQMWAVRSQMPNLKAVTDVVDVSMPVLSGETGVGIMDIVDGDNDTGNQNSDELIDNIVAQIDDLATYSSEPRVKFDTLIKLDDIKARNKPVTAPEKPKRAPFFLTAGVNGPADAEQEEMDVDVPLNIKPTVSEFTAILNGDNSTTSIGEYLAKLGPSATDLEIRTLDSPVPNGEIAKFINAMIDELRSGRHFELVQAWMAMLFKSHIGELAGNEFKDVLKEYEQAQSESINKVDEQARFCAGLIEFLRV